MGNENLTIEELVHVLVQNSGSDLHISAGARPKIRVHGSLIDTDYDILDPETTQRLMYSVIDNEQVTRLKRIGNWIYPLVFKA